MSPEWRERPQKEQILRTAPFLRTFLNVKAHRENPTEWQKELQSDFNTLESKFDTRLGENWHFTMLTPQFLMAKNYEIFSTNTDLNSQLGILNSMIKFGYELETTENAEMMLVDIVEVLSRGNVFNPNLVNSKEGSTKIVQFLTGLLDIGMYVRRIPEGGIGKIDSFGSPKSPIPDTFVDFIKGLDFDGI